MNPSTWSVLALFGCVVVAVLATAHMADERQRARRFAQLLQQVCETAELDVAAGLTRADTVPRLYGWALELTGESRRSPRPPAEIRTAARTPRQERSGANGGPTPARSPIHG